ncbi:WecA-like glycosyltransferase [Phycisphaerae bacterium RAS1]|nr:WecA-like glycosyltransferase [Phycisphaerae bacterium RAS1]
MSRPLLGLILLASALGAFALSAALTAMVRRAALRIGFVDQPGGHKSHRQATPYGGGVAIFLACWLPALLLLILAVAAPADWVARLLGETASVYLGGLKLRAAPASIILLGGAILHVMGLIDDRRPLGASAKLLVIFGVAVLVATLGRVRVAELAGDSGSILLTVLWFAVIINTFNFLDNMDGLSGGVAAICLGFLAICGLLAGQVLVPVVAIAALGAICGFLVFNFPPATIFMGDAGSLLIGYVLAVVSVLTTYYESGEGVPPYALAMPLVILAVPLYDCATVIAIRLREGRNPMTGDQRHFSHRLVDHGLSRRSAVLTIYLATATTGLAGTLLPGASLRETITIGILVLLVLGIVAILESPPRKDA